MAMNDPLDPARSDVRTGATQLGIWLIAVYWFTRSGVVISMWLMARSDSGITQREVGLIRGLAPFLWMFHPTPDQCIALAPASAVVGISAGIGVLLRQKWALAIIAFDRVFPFLRFIVFLPVLMYIDKGTLSSISASPLKLFDFAFTGFMAFYFFQRDVRRSFGFS
jgi:hypothetical protein